MTATNEAPGDTIDGTAVDEQRAADEHAGVNDAAAEEKEGVAEAAARDVARLLDRRGLRDIVALAHRVLRESTRLATSGGPRAEDPDATRCTLRQHERSTRRGAASRAVDDDRA
ncbi:MAG TPA: hypothetical protein VKZ81_07010 [Pseudonocardia sp.]|jgi:hypothetical protein|uniref:hypothetical protein n=1 Tax=Pseudonocardia sp. TaxID=60912 RepID=UPI002B4B57C3|nr:hypothetical protein [Pseudonocardia sp.]HLU55195.1 hypothetical protein [Pseudonocardia sp.]